jgi:putative ABC transport system substrate-binding protein
VVKERAEAVVIPETPVALSHGKQIVELATGHRLLTMWAPSRVAAGGVLGYGTRLDEAFQRCRSSLTRSSGRQPGRFAGGGRQSYELIVNLKAARAISATIPTDVLKRADRVIE